MNEATIAFIGCGNMGVSLLGGLIKDGYPPNKIWATNSTQEKLNILQQKFQTHVTTDNVTAVKAADVVILGVKPKHLAALSKELAEAIQIKKPLVISIAAGVRIASLQRWLGKDIAIVRAMPNTPAMIGCGATGLFANDLVSEKQHNLAEFIMRAVGVTVWLNEEKLLDAVTAISGSGPAYFFLIIEVMQKTAESLGLTKDIARLLTLQTAYGAARMALEADEDAIELRKRVTSPGGSTEQAIRVFEQENIHGMFLKALQTATKRAEELATLSDQEP